jgi:hypothetical protein
VTVRPWLIGLGIAALAAGCGGGAPPPPAPPTPAGTGTAAPSGASAAAQPAAPAVAPKEPQAGPPLPPATYDAKGRRDPFTPVTIAREAGSLNVSTARLVGLVQGRSGPMALVEAPDGIGYILKVGDALGDGRVTTITATSVTFAVTARGAQKSTSVTLRLATE